MKKVTQNILSVIIIAIAIQGCKKISDPTPQTITNTVTKTVHDTVKTTVTQTVIEHDTAYCISKADIISTWYCYKYANNINSPAQKVIFSADSAYWPSLSPFKIIYSSDFSTIHNSNGSLYATVYVNNCNEMKIIDATGTPYYFRRLP